MKQEEKDIQIDNTCIDLLMKARQLPTRLDTIIALTKSLVVYIHSCDMEDLDTDERNETIEIAIDLINDFHTTLKNKNITRDIWNITTHKTN